MDICSVASAIAGCVVPSISTEIGYIFSYQENLEKVKDKVQTLEQTEASVQQLVGQAKRNGEKILVNVQTWLKKSNDIVAKTKRLIDIEEDRWCLGQCPNLWTRNRMSREFKEMTQKITDIIHENNFDTISYHVPAEVTITPFCRGYEALDSRTSMLNEIKEVLKDPKIYMIGVHGMGGVGKTTLVNELAWQVRKDGSFGIVVIATITNYPNVEKIQDQIAETLLGRKLENTTKVGRAGELRQRIQHEKSVLIILDDIWSSELDLTEVGIPFGDEHNGCKLVMTSRDLNVLKKMGTQKEFDLRALLEEDSWILFQKMAGDVVKEFNIKPIAKRVAKCCAGLPLLIAAVAKGLRKKDVDAWRVSLNQLERFNHEELQKNVYPTLKLSYDCLENEELKSLFSFIGSFGVDHIHSGELFSCYWGLGFYGQMQTLTEARDKHYKLINDLRASSLLLEADAKPEWVKMHDVVRDVAKSIPSRFHPTYAVPRYTRMKEWPKVDQLQKCHYIFINWSYIYEHPKQLVCPELKLLLLENIGGFNLNVPENFFSRMRELRTLNLYGLSFTPSLPLSFHNLINLRTLDLCGCNLGDIRMVAKLTNLEILHLEGSSIKVLPKEIGHLTHLRLLNLADCAKLRVIPRNLISSLTSLEELYMGNCCIEWEVEGCKSESNNASLGELRNLYQLTTLEISIQDTSVLPRDLQFLAKLKRYIILIGDKWKWSLDWSGGARESSRTLKLTDSLWTYIPLTSVEDLSFAKLKSVEDVLYELNDEGFPQLKHLHIQDSDELLHIINSRGLVNPCSALPNLKTLDLHNLHNMEEICYGPLPADTFEKLEVIKVKDCNRLKNLFLYSLARNLLQLHEMKISNCKDMTEIIAKEKQEDKKELSKIVLPELHSLKLKGLPMLRSFYLPLTIDKDNPSIESVPLALFNQQVVMPKLETLTLNDINACKIWDDTLPALSSFQNLTCLIVVRCNRLTSLFSPWVARPLVKLQHLEISECSMLKEIFVHEEGEVQFPNMETLYISDMHDLSSIWSNQVAPNSFCKLRKIIIDGCESLDYVFSISVAKELRQLQGLEIYRSAIKNIVEKSDSTCHMTHVYLEELTIRHCHNMKTIVPSSVLFQSLDKLNVYGCDEVVNIIAPSTITSLPKLRILIVGGCGKLEEIYGSKNEVDAPLGVIAFMKLEELTLKLLPRLTSFCQGSYHFKFRSLQMVRLKACPMMETFCHGNLTTSSHTKVRCLYESEDHWDGDLNTTIRTIFTKKLSIQNTEQELNSSSESKDD